MKWINHLSQREKQPMNEWFNENYYILKDMYTIFLNNCDKYELNFNKDFFEEFVEKIYLKI